MKKYLNISSVSKYSEIDNYDSGCEGNGMYSSFDWQTEVEVTDTVEAAIQTLNTIITEEFGFSEYSECATEPGILSYDCLETNEGEKPTEREIQRWKDGKLVLYCAHYDFFIILVEKLWKND